MSFWGKFRDNKPIDVTPDDIEVEKVKQTENVHPKESSVVNDSDIASSDDFQTSDGECLEESSDDNEIINVSTSDIDKSNLSNSASADIIDADPVQDADNVHSSEETGGSVDGDIQNDDFDFVDDEIDNSMAEQADTSVDAEEPKDNQITASDEKKVRLRTINREQPTHLNGFDMFFIKVWAIIVGLISLIADGINNLIHLIFKTRLPRRYVKAFVSVLLIVLISLAVILPIANNSGKARESELEIFRGDLVPVMLRVGGDEINPVYKWGYASEKNAGNSAASEALRIPAIYDKAMPFNGFNLAWVCNINEGIPAWQLINTKGKRIDSGDVTITEVGQFAPNKLCRIVVGGKHGFINTRGVVAIQPTYDKAGDFVFELARVRQGDKEWYIDRNNNVVGRQGEYDRVLDFSSGYGAVCKDGKWGFIDESGDAVIALQYDAVTPFVDSYAMVKIGETIGIIDDRGRYVVSSSEYYDVYVSNPVFRLFSEVFTDGGNVYDWLAALDALIEIVGGNF